ncbi:hypothetical protein [Fortiea contorta]|uniref:hypothetical protein n=1 Tax=Fortiea contorta TaxID=1892405 RepID=UPI0003470281|nr:hypothetical protein [Fortiea contorta]
MVLSKKVSGNHYSAHKVLNSQAVRLTAPVLAITGWLLTIVPGVALTASYSNNDYRACAGQIIKVGVTPDAALSACAKALRPRELSTCVVKISQEAKIAATEALAGCRLVRRPEELATCVVNISLNTQGAVNPSALSYCGRSLLPVRFAQCVVGLRSEVKDLAPIRALDTCIDASDRVSGLTSGSTPPIIKPAGFISVPATDPIVAPPNSR